MENKEVNIGLNNKSRKYLTVRNETFSSNKEWSTAKIIDEQLKLLKESAFSNKLGHVTALHDSQYMQGSLSSTRPFTFHIIPTCDVFTHA